MIFNTIPYVELIQSKLDEFDKKVKEKHNILNPNFPYLTLSPQAEYVLAHGQQDNPQVEEKIREEIVQYNKDSENRMKAIQSGEIVIPEFETEELLNIFTVTEEELSPFIETKAKLLELIDNGSKKS